MWQYSYLIYLKLSSPSLIGTVRIYLLCTIYLQFSKGFFGNGFVKYLIWLLIFSRVERFIWRANIKSLVTSSKSCTRFFMTGCSFTRYLESRIACVSDVGAMHFWLGTSDVIPGDCYRIRWNVQCFPLQDGIGGTKNSPLSSSWIL